MKTSSHELPRRRAFGLKCHNPLRLAVTSILAIVLLVACSLVQLTYNHLNWVIPWYVDDYITLNKQQRHLLDELIKKELRWHRKTQLPEYASWLGEVSRDVKSGFTDAKVMQHIARFEEFRKVLMRESAANLAVLLETVSDTQVKEIFTNLEHGNQKFYEYYIGQPPAELQQKRIKRIEGIFADWLGPLTKAQRAAIDHWSHQRGSIAPAILAYRKQWQERFRTVLEQRTDVPRFTADLQLLLVSPHLYSPPTYLEKRKLNIELGKQLFLTIMNDATPVQRKRLLKTIDGYTRDCIELSMQT